ncbi:VOC family protein [Nonomuraea sp. RK-328]|nr:VOC family protein [Nonomuraea sp. RK-328]
MRETVIPILPCRDIDEVAAFYGMLGFAMTYRQTRPNPYVALRRDGIELHFAGISGFDPEQSYGSCIVAVDDTAGLFEDFATSMRAVHGKLLLTGIPRITRPRKRKNTGDVSGFSVVDPGGNWIRIFRSKAEPVPADSGDAASGPLARALENAIVQGEARGDTRQAAKILDGKLAGTGDLTPVTTLVEALVYRAELAVRLDDFDTAERLLARVADTPLDDPQRERLSDALANAADLGLAVRDVKVAGAGGAAGTCP